MSQTYFQKGFNLKSQVKPILLRDFASGLVDQLRQWDFSARAGDVTLRLAREFGFCYGVDRAVEYAYEAREKFPDKRIWLSGEIIHNPDVNARLAEMGLLTLPESASTEERYAPVTPEDVVVLPAFGVTASDMAYLRGRGLVVVDTTCGSVLNVWKNVHRYGREGYTAVIHGKHYHEETRATASQVLGYPGGHYLCVRDLAETDLVCAFVRGETSGAALLEKLGHAVSAGFDPDRDLQRIGLANQTTMLMGETVQVQERLKAAYLARYGAEALAQHFQSFDTICTATQDRQDAVQRLLTEGALSVMVVIGGYNSSNTQALARICAARLPTYHVRGPEGIGAEIAHRVFGGHDELRTPGWLPDGPITVGLTAGASTPNSVVAEVVQRILALRGLAVADLQPAG